MAVTIEITYMDRQDIPWVGMAWVHWQRLQVDHRVSRDRSQALAADRSRSERRHAKNGFIVHLHIGEQSQTKSHTLTPAQSRGELCTPLFDRWVAEESLSRPKNSISSYLTGANEPFLPPKLVQTPRLVSVCTSTSRLKLK